MSKEKFSPREMAKNHSENTVRKLYKIFSHGTLMFSTINEESAKARYNAQLLVLANNRRISIEEAKELNIYTLEECPLPERTSRKSDLVVVDPRVRITNKILIKTSSTLNPVCKECLPLFNSGDLSGTEIYTILNSIKQQIYKQNIVEQAEYAEVLDDILDIQNDVQEDREVTVKRLIELYEDIEEVEEGWCSTKLRTVKRTETSITTSPTKSTVSSGTTSLELQRSWLKLYPHDKFE